MDTKIPFIPNFTNVPEAPADAILSLIVRYKQDTNPNKVDLGVGAYRTQEGKPYIFKCVREAEQRIIKDESLTKEY